MLAFIFIVAGLSPVEVLWFRLGVPVGSKRMKLLQRRVERSWKDQAVFEDQTLLDRRAAALEVALGPEAARLVMLRSPLVLASDLELTLTQRLDALHELLPDINLSHLLVRAPALLELDLHQTIEPRVRQLEAMVPSSVGVERIVRRSPTLLQLSDLAQRLETIATLLPGVDMSRAPLALVQTHTNRAHDPPAACAADP